MLSAASKCAWCGARFNNARIAPLVRCLARNSSTCPRIQTGDHRGRLEINRRGAVHAPKGGWENLWEKSSYNAVEIRGACAQSNQREHVRAAVDERRPEALEKRPAAAKDHWR